VHFHGFLWTGPKQRFDEDALRRPVPAQPPPAEGRPEAVSRYRDVAAAFRKVNLPPLETAFWLLKPPELVRGTWEEAKEAAAWLGEQLSDAAPRFAFPAQRDPVRLAGLADAAADRLGQGGEVSHGFYLDGPAFLSVAVVPCSPNRTRPELRCPLL
jgi:hypothetical protein